jgi:hypothetical protein
MKLPSFYLVHLESLRLKSAERLMSWDGLQNATYCPILSVECMHTNSIWYSVYSNVTNVIKEQEERHAYERNFSVLDFKGYLPIYHISYKRRRDLRFPSSYVKPLFDTESYLSKRLPKVYSWNFLHPIHSTSRSAWRNRAPCGRYDC